MEKPAELSFSGLHWALAAIYSRGTYRPTKVPTAPFRVPAQQAVRHFGQMRQHLPPRERG